MSSYLLERIRASHELIESCEELICTELDNKPNGQRAKVLQQHTVSALLDEMVSKNAEIKQFYEDIDGLLKEELGAIGSNVFNSFYEALNSTKEYHARFLNLNKNPSVNLHGNSNISVSNNSSGGPISDVTRMLKVPFSGEEVYGKYLDLHYFYVEYCNLPNITSRDQDFIQYLDKFYSFFHLSESIKGNKPYKTYIAGLLKYLISFLGRVQPLIDLNSMMEREWKVAFEQKWGECSISGWKNKSASTESQPLRLGMFNTQEELVALGTERLREALDALGLKCGGTIQDRAARLWSVRGISEQDIPQKLKAKRNAAGPSDAADWRKETAWSEYLIGCICEFMMDIVIATQKHAEKQQARTVEEKEAELREEEHGQLPNIEDAADEDDDGPIYNPLNIPLDWNGKPIPYWMFKLHGLGVEFKCEICGNQSYWGRQAFDRHFQQPRHVHSMRVLGIPNTKHFHDITKIEDALLLYEKIKNTLSQEQFKGDEEEFEDTQGNVLKSRRTYEDFTRQGLL